MLHYKYETSDGLEGFYYDKMRLNLDIAANELRKLLPINDLREASGKFVVSKSSDQAQKFGLTAKIEMVSPSQKCLEILDEHLPPSITMKISYVEIARDTFVETEQEAWYAFNKLLPTIRKKYTSRHFIYDQFYEEEGKKRENKHKIDKTLFSDKTGYFGSETFKYVPYPRLSKINNRPCIHAEWRITGAPLLKRKTGIVSIRDLITFDLLKFFDEQEKRFIVHESIDLMKLGRWLLGWNRKKSFPKRASMRMGFNGRIFCDAYKIKTYADLVSHLMIVKEKLKRKRGPKTPYQERFLSLKDYRIFRELKK